MQQTFDERVRVKICEICSSTRAMRTDFVQDENELLAFRLAPPDLLFHEPAPAALRISRIENEDDDVALVDDLVQRADVEPAQLLLRFLLRPGGGRVVELGGRVCGRGCGEEGEGGERRLGRHRRVWVF